MSGSKNQRKSNKRFWRIVMWVGLAGTAGFGTLLGIGANAKYHDIGIGSITFGYSWKGGIKHPITTPLYYGNTSYDDYVKWARTIKEGDIGYYISSVVIKAYDEMVSGAVLTTIFALTTISAYIRIKSIKNYEFQEELAEKYRRW